MRDEMSRPIEHTFASSDVTWYALFCIGETLGTGLCGRRSRSLLTGVRATSGHLPGVVKQQGWKTHRLINNSKRCY